MRLSCPENLPIKEKHDEIIQALKTHQCLIVLGDTGSGKTTQLPKMCLEAGLGQNGLIGCTQPRRIAALSVAERVAEETGAAERIGCKIRFLDQTNRATRIKFMTDGVLLAETRSDPALEQYEVLIIDEAHERGLNIDFLLGYLKRLLPQRPGLKLVISSATIDAGLFSRHFDNAPVIEVAGRGFPIRTEYWDEGAGGEDADISYVERAVAAVRSLCSSPSGGDILVFMPTERDINDTIDGLSDLNATHCLLPLFGRLPTQAQRAVFQPAKKRKIIVATNVAETSITVPGIRMVVDTGLARISRYNPKNGTTSLRISRVSQASCNQRQGRAGRVGPGLCIRLYSEEDLLSREPFSTPEIKRANLAEVILRMQDLGLGEPATFPFLDPPPGNAIKDGYRLLEELGAFCPPKTPGARRELNSRGRFMASLPLDPRMSRILLEAEGQGSLKECAVLAAALAIQDPRIRPPGQEGKADMAHQVFQERPSDFLSLLNIWRSLMAGGEGERPGAARLARFCKTHFLSWQRMREWLDVHEQILRILGPKARLNPEPASYAAIHKALASGFLRNICQKKEKNSYVAAAGREVVLFPGSCLYNHGPEWALAAEFVETSQLFARSAAAISPDWLELLAGDLCKKSWSEPHWEKKSGRVMALEKVTLFGLVIVAGRRVDYGHVSERAAAEARAIFMREALVSGNLGASPREFPFLAANLALRKRFLALEDRVRRRGIVADEEALFAFYDARLGKVWSRSGLKKFLHRAGTDDMLRLHEADICLAEPASDELYRYPPSLRSAGMNIPLVYHFAPGANDDGVSALVAARQLPELDPRPFEWLVPGLLPEKVFQLCKRLPKHLRRELVPLPEAAARITDGLNLYAGSLYEELERVILQFFQVSVRRSDWQTAALPLHLKMRFALQDENGTTLAESRSLAELCQRGWAESKNAEQKNAAWPKARLLSKDAFDQIERTIVIKAGPGGPELLAWAALRLNERGEVELYYTKNTQKNTTRTAEAKSPAEAPGLTRASLHALLTAPFHKEAALLRKACKEALSAQSASWLALGSGYPAAILHEQLFAFTLDAVFPLNMTDIPSQDVFDAALSLVRKEGLLKRAKPVLELVSRLLRQRREVLTLIEAWAERARRARCYEAARYEAYQNALERLIPAHFLEELNAAALSEASRYLQALSLRIERAEHDPGKDSKKAERLKTAAIHESEAKKLLAAAETSGPGQALLYEYITLVEEFRVSVFAPELGVKAQVSEKRLQEKWLEIENARCRVE